ncbi:MAG: anti-sigma factor [Acidimicrobiia bacterium]|nr:anti-sigma factor [Acidimicrobiia bacterium]
MTDSDDAASDATLDIDDDVRALLADQRIWEEPPHDMADRVVATVRSETPSMASPRAGASVPSRRILPSGARPALRGAAAVVLVFFGGIAVFSAVDDPSVGTRVAVLLPTGLAPAEQGEAEFERTDAGVSIDLTMPSLPPLEGENFYEGWVHTSDGHAIPAGTFHGGDDVDLWAAADLEEIEEFTVTRELAVEPASAEHRSSGEVVLKGTIASD